MLLEQTGACGTKMEQSTVDAENDKGLSNDENEGGEGRR